jgi:EAL domain-containing protein (putative c-di-GMP-specific phosphodiesterase class I)
LRAEHLASRWGSTVVAEGVETSEHFEIVRDLGVYAAQGYLIGYPDELPESTVSDIRSVTTRISLLRQMLGPSVG